MKYGRTLTELAIELDRQRNAKRDYLLDTRNIIMDSTDDGQQLTLQNPQQRVNTVLRVNDIAHGQIGQALGIPAKYYNKMRSENPELLAANVNSWFNQNPALRMVRTLDGTARAFLSDRYRRIDNYEIAEAVLPIIGDLPDARIESCEVTDERMYIKVVNPRLTTEVTPGDVVQSGILITNSEVGMGSTTTATMPCRITLTSSTSRIFSARPIWTPEGNILARQTKCKGVIQLTQKELGAVSDLEFAAQILQQRLDKIYNPNSPLASKLRCAIHRLRGIDIKEQTRPAGYWFVQYYDTAGEHIPAMKLTTEELVRIGNLVQVGYTSGEIAEDAIS